MTNPNPKGNHLLQLSGVLYYCLMICLLYQFQEQFINHVDQNQKS